MNLNDRMTETLKKPLQSATKPVLAISLAFNFRHFRHFLLCPFLPVLASLVLLCGAAGIGRAEQRAVTAAGVGFVAGGDLAAARDGAIRDAQLRALEQVVGVEVDARSVLHKELLIDDTVVTRTGGAIRTYTVLDETADENGLYRVRIEALVDAGAMRTELMRAAGNKKVLLVNASAVSGRDHPGDMALAQSLAEAFSSAGFKLERSRVSETEISLLDEEKVRRIGRQTGRDMVAALWLRGSEAQCMADNFCAASAGGFVRIFSGKTGAALAAAEAEGVRGFGNTGELAAADARRQAAAQLMDGLMGKFGRPREYEVRVAVLRLPDHASYRALRTSLAALRWVSAVEEDAVGYHPQKSVFLVRFGQDLDLFAAMLSKMGRYSFLGRSGSVFTLEFKGG